MKKPWTSGNFSGEEVQRYVRIMTGRQRKLWTKAKLPVDRKSLEEFSGEAMRRQYGAPSRLLDHEENMARGRAWREKQFVRALCRRPPIPFFVVEGRLKPTIELFPLDLIDEAALRRRMLGRD